MPTQPMCDSSICHSLHEPVWFISLCLQSMVKDWELFKVAVESSRQPELMLIVDKWKQLQFVSREYFAQ